MSDGYIVEAVSRDAEFMGKGASRRLRRQKNMIPAIVYGTKKEAKSIMIAHDALLHSLDHESFYASILDLKIDGGKPEQVILKALQRHAFKPKLLHADFMRVSAKTELKVTVPIHFLGQEESPGIKEGGIMSHATTEIEVICLPKDLPGSLEIDVSALEMSASLHLSDIKLPEGVKITVLEQEEPNNLAVAAVHMPKVVEEPEEELEAAEGEGGEEGAGESADKADADDGAAKPDEG